MDKRRICKICNRRFANGKAMGGHMRSHLAKLPVPTKPQTPVESAPRFLSSSSSLSFHSAEDNMHAIHHRSVVSDMHDGESETESPRNNPTRRRSERRGKAVAKVGALPPPPAMVVAEADSVSSVSENFSDEEIAMCLLMLSRDKWPSGVVLECVENGKEVGQDEDALFCDHDFKTKRKRYKCQKCKKIFPSYQALGGHKASHKRIKIHFKRDEYVHSKLNNNNNNKSSSNGFEDQSRIFECPFCEKVFESGQALGGHKKVHFSYLTVNPKPHAKSSENLNIDLNLPAPEEDSEVSHV